VGDGFEKAAASLARCFPRGRTRQRGGIEAGVLPLRRQCVVEDFFERFLRRVAKPIVNGLIGLLAQVLRQSFQQALHGGARRVVRGEDPALFAGLLDVLSAHRGHVQAHHVLPLRARERAAMLAHEGASVVHVEVDRLEGIDAGRACVHRVGVDARQQRHHTPERVGRVGVFVAPVAPGGGDLLDAHDLVEQQHHHYAVL
jgi:hypothetical protein